MSGLGVKMQKFTIFMLLFSLLFFSSLPGSGQEVHPRFTFSGLLYPAAQYDSMATREWKEHLSQQHPHATDIQVFCMIAPDSLMRVVSYYAILTQRRYEMVDGHIIFPFKKSQGGYTEGIEIYSQPIPRINPKFWPTRIALIQIKFPLRASTTLKRSLQTLREKAQQFYYEGRLREDIAAILLEELGERAEVFVIDTSDSFEQVYQFFQRRYGRIRIISVFNEDIRERDFEIDVTARSKNQLSNKELHIRVLENPLITDVDGNSLRYKGHVFIQYTFWQKEEVTSY